MKLRLPLILLITSATALVQSLIAAPMTILHLSLHYDRTEEELTLLRYIVRQMPMPVPVQAECPAFLGQTLDVNRNVICEISIPSPMYMMIPPPEDGSAPHQSIIEKDESRFAFVFPKRGNETHIRVFELKCGENETPELLGEIELQEP